MNSSYVAFIVEDLEKSREFYEKKIGEILGIKIVYTTPTGNFIQLDVSGIPIALFRKNAAKTVIPKNVDLDGKNSKFILSLQVDDIDLVYEKLKERGVVFIDKPTNWFYGQRSVRFLDPDGNLIEIFKTIPRK